MVQPTPRQERLLRRTFVDFTQTSQILQDPLILERGEGLYCWDSEGKRYYDSIGGIFFSVLQRLDSETHQHQSAIGSQSRVVRFQVGARKFFQLFGGFQIADGSEVRQ